MIKPLRHTYSYCPFHDPLPCQTGFYKALAFTMVTARDWIDRMAPTLKEMASQVGRRVHSVGHIIIGHVIGLIANSAFVSESSLIIILCIQIMPMNPLHPIQVTLSNITINSFLEKLGPDLMKR